MLKQGIMDNVWINKTGMTRKEIEAFYLENINMLMSLGVKEEIAREIVQETLKESLGL